MPPNPATARSLLKGPTEEVCRRKGYQRGLRKSPIPFICKGSNSGWLNASTPNYKCQHLIGVSVPPPHFHPGFRPSPYDHYLVPW